MSFYITNKDNRPLSQFESNNLATQNQLKFRTRDCISFPTRQEAARLLDYIRQNIIHGNTKNLKISEYIVF